MEIIEEQDGPVVIVQLRGRLDGAGAKPAEDRLIAALGSAEPHLAIDMTELQYISSAGLRVLLLVAKKVQQLGGKLALFGLGANVREVFSVSGFDAILPIFKDRGGALAAVA